MLCGDYTCCVIIYLACCVHGRDDACVILKSMVSGVCIRMHQLIQCMYNSVIHVRTCTCSKCNICTCGLDVCAVFCTVLLRTSWHKSCPLHIYLTLLTQAPYRYPKITFMNLKFRQKQTFEEPTCHDTTPVADPGGGGGGGAPGVYPPPPPPPPQKPVIKHS